MGLATLEECTPQAGQLYVGTNKRGEVIINHPDLQPDENGVGHIVFSPAQARELAEVLLKQAAIAEGSSAPEFPGTYRCKQDGRIVIARQSCGKLILWCEATRKRTRCKLEGFRKAYERVR